MGTLTAHRRGTDLGRQDSDCTSKLHGTVSAYRNGGCRCPHAREQMRIYDKRLSHGRLTPRYVDPTGTGRRLRALAAIGWRWQDMGDRLGVTGQSVQGCAIGKRRVHIVTAQRVAHLYDQLSTTPGPSAQTRNLAAVKGWPPPLAWDDDTIDDPNAQPYRALGEDTPVVDGWDLMIIADRTLRGERRYMDLTTTQRVATWQLWQRERRARGLNDGPREFAKFLDIPLHVAGYVYDLTCGTRQSSLAAVPEPEHHTTAAAA